MSKVSVTKDKLDILANAIANKSGEPLTLTLDEMVSAVDGIETGGGGITPTGNIDITQAGVTDVTNYATATVPNAGYVSGVSYWYETENNQRKFVTVGQWNGIASGFIKLDEYQEMLTPERKFNAIPTGTTVTPTELAQTIGGADTMMEGAVTVSAIPSNYVGSGITQRSSSDLTVSGATVTALSGYYSASASKSVASGTAGTPTATKGTVSNNSVTVTPSVTNTTGYITGGTKNGTAVTVSASELVSGTKSITANGTGIDVTNYASVDVDVPSSSSNDFIVTLTQNQQGEWMPDCTYAELYSAYTAGKNIVATAGGSSAVSIFFENNYFYYSVHDMFDEYDSSGIYDWGVISGDYTFSSEGAELDEEARYYNLSLGNATPSDVTSGKRFYNSQGIQVGTNSGGGDSKNAQTVQGTTRTTSATLTAIGAEMTVSKTGTYDVYWSAFRSNTSSQYTFGTRLYIDGTAYGTEQTGSWSNHVQNIHLSNVSLTANQKIRVYGRESRGSSYYMYCGQLTIIEA